MTLGQRFRYYRVRANLTQKEAAKLIGINDYQLGNYETNRSEPNITTLKKMSQVYRVSIDKLVNNNIDKKEEPKIIDDDGIVDVDELSRRLSEIADRLNKVDKK